MARRRLTQLLIAGLVISVASAAVSAADKSFSSVVKQIESNYSARRRGIPFMGLARLAVKIVKPAGVKNFKLVVFETLDISANQGDAAFQPVRDSIGPEWQALASYVSRPKRQWAYVYVRQEDNDMKVLVVTLQRKDAFVAQVKFSPEKLARFLENPEILGIPLNSRDEQSPSKPPAQNETDSQKPPERPVRIQAAG